ncbi:MAG: hypothetical protein P8Y70_21390 [Candidatus Lokiarchaeota archaeon]
MFRDSDDYIVVATTRPETLLGVSGVAISPDDKKKQHLIGKDNWKFWDENLIKFKNLINLEADFKPNIEAKNIPLEQKTIGDEENESVTSKGSQTIIQRWKCLRSLSRVN